MGTRSIPNVNPTVREIHRRMVAAGLNNYSFAKKIGVNDTYFRDMYKSQSAGPRISFLPAIAAALECKVSDLLNPSIADPASREPEVGSEEDQAEEIALMGLWRILTPEARRRIMRAIIREVSKSPTSIEGDIAD